MSDPSVEPGEPADQADPRPAAPAEAPAPVSLEGPTEVFVDTSMEPPAEATGPAAAPDERPAEAPQQPAPRSTSARIFGKYRLLAELGRGGMADVHLAVAAGPAGFSKLQVIKRLRP